MNDDVLISKAATLERCVMRAREELAASADFHSDFTRQDAAILNVQRACETAIDIAYRLVKLRGLGSPATHREAIDLLVDADLMSAEKADGLKRMTGFRNIAVHRYLELDMRVVEHVIRHSLDDLLDFSALALRLP